MYEIIAREPSYMCVATLVAHAQAAAHGTLLACGAPTKVFPGCVGQIAPRVPTWAL